MVLDPVGLGEKLTGFGNEEGHQLIILGVHADQGAHH
jgi:hypothetical protein